MEFQTIPYHIHQVPKGFRKGLGARTHWFFLGMGSVLLFMVGLAAIAAPPTLTPGPDGFSLGAYDIILTNDRICKHCRIRPAGVDVSNFRLYELMDSRGYRGTYREEDLLGINTQPKKRWFARKQIHGVGLPGKVISPHAYDYDKENPPLPYYYK